MARTVGIGIQDFEKMIRIHNFYIDRTGFIRDWWENADEVTLITRPRRFGKTLTVSMLEHFFSIQYKEQGDIFQNLAIWKDEKFRRLQGTYPVICLSFANVKENTCKEVKRHIGQILTELYDRHIFLLEGDLLTRKEKSYFCSIDPDMDELTAVLALHRLSDFLFRYYGKKVIILLDEYDTPMQEAYIHGFWQQLASYMRNMLNAVFKTNPYLERALMTGITRVSKESIFSDLNHLEVVTTTSEKYKDVFGLSEEEVFLALEEYGLSAQRQSVKDWYDGFVFGGQADIYNPWSVINCLDKRKLSAYWANSSSNGLADRLIRESSAGIKADFEELLKGKSLEKEVDEQVVFDQLSRDENAIWSLLLACGYLKVEKVTTEEESGVEYYTLSLTNKEVRMMFRNMVKGWFAKDRTVYNQFIKALLLGDVDAMNQYMNRVSRDIFSTFDTGKKPSEETEPERFYHGFVLGLMVELSGRYVLTSNRESGFGRYDVMLEPLREEDDAILLEFKVYDPGKEKTLEETVERALMQIREKEYASVLESKGIPHNRIRLYGFGFRGKEVLIGHGQ